MFIISCLLIKYYNKTYNLTNSIVIILLDYNVNKTILLESLEDKDY